MSCLLGSWQVQLNTPFPEHLTLLVFTNRNVSESLVLEVGLKDCKTVVESSGKNSL